ncbi:hypothetical protein MSAN_02002400 [Mycena sanguinolenta]|uniref:Uncharacterized protein n=1 Tax=Mycena sanguinolenta TaxID=230812 RepID=A0A8H6XLY3_9AGAR|nr:hypothetical protein MSAN_02002400 [Mycena sanguinolenta]
MIRSTACCPPPRHATDAAVRARLLLAASADDAQASPRMKTFIHSPVPLDSTRYCLSPPRVLATRPPALEATPADNCAVCCPTYAWTTVLPSVRLYILRLPPRVPPSLGTFADILSMLLGSVRGARMRRRGRGEAGKGGVEALLHVLPSLDSSTLDGAKGVRRRCRFGLDPAKRGETAPSPGQDFKAVREKVL